MSTRNDDPQMSFRSCRRLLLALSFAAPLLGAPRADAQQLLQQAKDPSFSQSADTRFGTQTDFAGDLDQDGYDDFVVSAPNWNGNQGRIWAYSGRTALELWRQDGPEPFARFGIGGIASLGRIDGDSVPDLIVSGGGGDNYAILSGATGSRLHLGSLHPMRCQVGAVGDLDGDSVAEYLVTYRYGLSSSPGVSNGRAYVISGATHQPIRSYTGSFTNGIEGAVSLGDLNHDGRNEYAIWFGCVSPSCGAGYKMYSGIDGSLLHDVSFGSGLFSLTRMAPVGDFNGDGTDDFYWYLEAAPFFKLPNEVAVNRIVSGADGSTLQEFPPPFFPYIPSGFIPDQTGDGRDELLALSLPGATSVVVLDPTNLSELLRVQGGPGLEFNRDFYPYLRSGGDVNGDGFPDILSSTFETSGSVPRRVLIYSGDLNSSIADFCFGDGGASPGCAACPCSNDASPGERSGCRHAGGNGAQLRGQGSLNLSGDRLAFELYRAPAGGFALLASGNLQLPTQGPCAPGSGVSGMLTDGLRCIGGDFGRHGTRMIDAFGGVGTTGPGWGAFGESDGSLLSQSGAIAGQARYFQALYRDDVSAGCGTGINTSNAVSLTPIP